MSTVAPTEPLDAALRETLGRLARVPQLLVAVDYDGTLAPIVDDPAAARPLPEAVAALRALAELAQTKVAVVSGRSLRDLAALSRLPSEIHLVGSHGSEFDVGFVQQLSEEARQLRTTLQQQVERIAAGAPGVRLEAKPASVAVHTRTASDEVASKVNAAVRSGPATLPGVHVTEGKKVIELSVVHTDKGTALDTLRSRLGASAVLFIGDDVTDENGFARLRGPDVGVKVGFGDTRATHRVADPVEVAKLLALVLDIRRRWLYGERAVPIERHSMLAGGDNLALLTPDARITWLCHPRPDSAAIFADLLGGSPAGHFSVAPQRGGLPLGQKYVGGSMTVQTRWSGLSVTDWLDPAGPANRTTLVRQLTGSVSVRVQFAPRPEFGQVAVRLQPLGDGLVMLGSNEPAVLYSPGVDWDIVREGEHDTAHALIDLRAAGGSAVLELRCGTDSLEADPLPADRRADDAARQWRGWLDGLRLPGVSTDLVARSALTLRALTYRPTGAILAAGTCSLPEELGGVRNWDYRYCWLRDAALAARALVDLGSVDEAEGLLAWTAGVIERTGGHPERLHPLYTVEGQTLGPEAVIDTLPGYAGSRPVRVGNAANKQLQLDVFGPIADLVDAVAQRRGVVSDFDREVLTAMVDAVARRWFEPDHGIWEQRQPPRHHVYSKVMCWQTVDRALRVAARHGLPERPDWVELRAAIADNVLEYGWNEQVGAYTTAYDGTDLDAASLWVGLSGLLADDDPRFLSTVLAIEAELRSGPVVYRYRSDDGMPGVEGGFHVCTAWLIESYLRTGRRADAEQLYGQLVACCGPTGLLPEQYDPLAERGLGNHPQAYSHLGLIRCALLLDARR
ncbi:trehalose-phosphatase [Actinocatenispora thailandica]|uniref:Trehalose-phosphatase n=1 Tax=Actinocatenispora thailandica TaxID=227318 RepID=A0A7R7HVR1_9ACTN|nr:trehalose-phosphatase [Actinocatenispora thailandica]BCJ34432.1 trehalose-phosphatase [Actinocatenispora thailandica]